MKAYFPGLNHVKEVKKNMFPPPHPVANRSSTTGSNKLGPHSERIIFVENPRRQG